MAFGLVALLLVFACRRNYVGPFPVLPVFLLSFYCYRLDISVDRGVRCLVIGDPSHGLPSETGNESKR